MTGRLFIRSLAVCAVAAVALAGCRDEEQDRFVRYEPGVYKGKNASQPLSGETLATLRGRVKDSVRPPGGGGGVRLPQDTQSGTSQGSAAGAMRIDVDALRSRGRLQKDSGQ